MNTSTAAAGKQQTETANQPTVHYCRFDSIQAKTGERGELSWPDFVKAVEKQSKITADKSDQILLCPAQLTDNEGTEDGPPRRSAGHVASRELIVLDVESAKDATIQPPSVENMAEKLRSFKIPFCLYTTFSHTPAKPRYRVIIPHNIPGGIDPTLPICEELAERLWLSKFIDTTKTGAQSLFYLPTCHPARKDEARFLYSLDGDPVDSGLVKAAEERQARIDKVEKRKAQEAAARAAERAARRAKIAPDGETYIQKARAAVPTIEHLLAQHGYRQRKVRGDIRFIFPGSTTGTYGIVILRGDDGIDRVYSHHADDPLCDGKAHDSIDVFTILEHGGNETAAREAIEKLLPRSDCNRDTGYGGDFQEEAGQQGSSQKAELKKPNRPQHIIPADQFIADLPPPDYILDGIMQRGWLYAMTAPTGMGKTAVALEIAARVATGRKFGDLEVQQGNVLFLAGENADDVRARVLMLCERDNIKNLPMFFVDRVFSIDESLDWLEDELKEIGGATLIIVDTVAAFFAGDDENSNAAMGEYARLLRRMTQLPGRPSVMALAHPVKNPSKSNLDPRGGGAFINELDGNLRLWSDGDGVTELHWFRKIRGPEFDPILLKLEQRKSDSYRDSKLRQVPSVLARIIEQIEAEDLAQTSFDIENAVLLSLEKQPGLSLVNRADQLGTSVGKVRLAIKRLENQKLVAKGRNGKMRITPAGEAEIFEIRETMKKEAKRDQT